MLISLLQMQRHGFISPVIPSSKVVRYRYQICIQRHRMTSRKSLLTSLNVKNTLIEKQQREMTHKRDIELIHSNPSSSVNKRRKSKQITLPSTSSQTLSLIAKWTTHGDWCVFRIGYSAEQTQRPLVPGCFSCYTKFVEKVSYV